MKLTWKSPAWSVQHHLAERALALWFFDTKLRAQASEDDIMSDIAVHEMKWDVYWLLLDMRNVLLDRERA